MSNTTIFDEVMASVRESMYHQENIANGLGADHLYIFDRLVPEWAADFATNAADYGDAHRDLGLKAQFVDLNRKVSKLKKAMWEGQKLNGEQPREILLDIIGHCFLAVAMIDRPDPSEALSIAPVSAVPAPAESPTRDNPADSQIKKLAEFIMEKVPGEPSQSAGAVDTAIRIIEEQQAAIVTMAQQSADKAPAGNLPETAGTTLPDNYDTREEPNPERALYTDDSTQTMEPVRDNTPSRGTATVEGSGGAAAPAPSTSYRRRLRPSSTAGTGTDSSTQN